MTSRRANGISDAAPDDSPRRRAVRQQRRLSVVGQHELLGRTVEAKLAERETESLVDFLENLAGFRKFIGQLLSHAGLLRPLPGKQQYDVHLLKAHYHRRPCKSGAESDKENCASFVNLTALDRLVERNWN